MEDYKQHTKTSQDLSEKVLLPQALGELFPKEQSGSEGVVQGKLVSIVKECDEDVMLAASVTLRDGGIEKGQPEKAVKAVANWQQLRAIYEDSQAHETLDDTIEDMDEKEDMPAGPTRKDNHQVFQETSTNSRLLQTKTTKTRKVQELVVPKIPMRADSVGTMTGCEKDDEMSLALMISSWVLHQHLAKTFLEKGLLVKLLSRRCVREMKSRPSTQRDSHIQVELANDKVTTSDKYLDIAIKVERVEAVMKAWLVDDEVYDVLLGMDWGYLKHTADEVIDIYENYVSLIFGHSEAMYSDNGSHFVNQKMQDYFLKRGVTHYTGPVSHPSSTRLFERAVQSMMLYLRGRCIKRGLTEKIYGYAPSKLMIGFGP